jgi:hypothetical protein
VAGLCWLAPSAIAIPSAPMVVCEMWPDIDACRGGVPSCDLCHTSTAPVAWNEFGLNFFGADGADCPPENNRWMCFRDPFDAHLRDTLADMATDPGDADGDCVDDVTELLYGTNHVDADEYPWEPFVPPTPQGDTNPYYDVGTTDWPFAYRRVKAAFCGLSPTYEELTTFTGLDEAAQSAALHDTLDTCLESPFWLVRALPRMADERIRPIKEVSADGSGDVATLGDYNDDYLLFVWAMSGDRDARDLLLADYHVRLNGAAQSVADAFMTYDGPGGGAAPSQPLDTAHRAGMITTQWFMIVNTMFSDVPRTTAAQSLRAYLGMDIALSQGMYPIADEPLDVDDKGVTAEPCSHCHATLDPLAYAFAEYNGIGGGGSNGTYDPARAIAIFEAAGIAPADRPKPALFGQSIDWDQGESTALVAWAQLAANSEAFKRTIATMLFERVLGRHPAADELAEFTDWWMSWGEDDGYSANELLHDLIDLHAFGAP